jgi:hypothetical protein
VRRILEAALAREFVAKATPADYKRIEKHLTAERKSLGGNDAQTRTRLLGDFHIVLAEVAGNNVLTGNHARAVDAQRRDHDALPEPPRCHLFVGRTPRLHRRRARGRCRSCREADGGTSGVEALCTSRKYRRQRAARTWWPRCWPDRSERMRLIAIKDEEGVRGNIHLAMELRGRTS